MLAAVSSVSSISVNPALERAKQGYGLACVNVCSHYMLTYSLLRASERADYTYIQNNISHINRLIHSCYASMKVFAYAIRHHNYHLQ